jgi:hypothetical protein
VHAEALTRNLDVFSRFLVAASFCQASVLPVAAIARDLGLARKTVDGCFDLLEDLLLAVRLPVFARRAKRSMAAHPKFFFFETYEREHIRVLPLAKALPRLGALLG